jgi:hypothetical protein
MAKKKSEIQELSEFVRDNMLTRKEFQEEVGEIKQTLGEHTKALNEHTRQLNQLPGDTNIMRDKRMQLEVRA